MAALVARVDGGGRRQIVLANQALATLLGESVARLVGGDLTRFLPREDLSAGPFRDGAAKGGAAGGTTRVRGSGASCGMTGRWRGSRRASSPWNCPARRGRWCWPISPTSLTGMRSSTA